MTKRVFLSVVLLLATFSLIIRAEKISSQILLPDGNSAPYAEVHVDGEIFFADELGNVTFEVPTGKKIVTVKWLALSSELPIANEMKFSNKLYYGAPYSSDDFEISGPDIWQIEEKTITVSSGSETVIFYDDSFANFVLRAKVTIDKADLYYAFRFLFRTTEPGFNGYCFSVPALDGSQTYFARYEGAWNKYEEIVKPMFLTSNAKMKAEYEYVIFAKNEKIMIYMRPTTERNYRKILDAEDKTEGAVFDGGFSLMSSFVEAKITELSVFSY